jgi:hypothetical protein
MHFCAIPHLFGRELVKALKYLDLLILLRTVDKVFKRGE